MLDYRRTLKERPEYKKRGDVRVYITGKSEASGLVRGEAWNFNRAYQVVAIPMLLLSFYRSNCRVVEITQPAVGYALVESWGFGAYSNYPC